jgi:ketosteroid isomerase-like protein
MSARFATPEQAEAAFYRALEQADLGAMMAVWAEDEEIVCIHPGGPRLIGLAAVRDAWRQIFAAGPRLHFRRLDARIQPGRMISVHSLVERITVSGDLRPHLVLATNVYVLSTSGWRMLMHHASPMPPSAAPPEPVGGTLH